MELITDGQFDDLESYVRARLEELFEDQTGHPLWEPSDDGGPRGYPSEMMFLCNVWEAMQEWFGEHGVTDGFTFEVKVARGYPTLDNYDEEKVRSFGQIIGDVIVALNPAGYADADPDQPFTDTREKFGPGRPFAFEPLPTPDEWEDIGADELHREPTESTVTRAKRFAFRDDLWFELWEENLTGTPNEPVREDDGAPATWTAQLCAPRETATMHETTMPRWIAIGYLDYYDKYRHLDDYEHVYRFRPALDEHQAWAIAADFWQGIAYRYQ